VDSARERQNKRFLGTGISFNAAIPGGHVRDYSGFSKDGYEHYRNRNFAAATNYGLF
jgi:hypothetical protein